MLWKLPEVTRVIRNVGNVLCGLSTKHERRETRDVPEYSALKAGPGNMMADGRIHLVSRLSSLVSRLSSLVNIPLHAPSSRPMTAASSDADLVAMWQRGDEVAAAEIVRRHAAPIGRYLTARGATSAERDDLIQETLFRAFRAMASWRGEGSLRGWMFRIAANLLKDRFRHDGGRVFVEILEDDLVGRADPASELAADETAKRIQEGLATLSPMQREVFLLRVEQGLDYRDVAVVLATTEGAARVHYHHAVKRLRERLQ